MFGNGSHTGGATCRAIVRTSMPEVPFRELQQPTLRPSGLPDFFFQFFAGPAAFRQVLDGFHEEMRSAGNRFRAWMIVFCVPLQIVIEVDNPPEVAPTQFCDPDALTRATLLHPSDSTIAS